MNGILRALTPGMHIRRIVITIEYADGTSESRALKPGATLTDDGVRHRETLDRMELHDRTTDKHIVTHEIRWQEIEYRKREQ